MNSIIGAIFPISESHFLRIFDENRTVFVKFTRMTKLRKNSVIVFYVSKKKRLMGEGLIQSIAKLNPDDAWKLYGDKIFLDAKEYENYIVYSPIGGKSRGTSQVTVFFLKSLTKYEHSPIIEKFTPSGQYLLQEEYKKIRNDR
jgi:hypothetical protein